MEDQGKSNAIDAGLIVAYLTAVSYAAAFAFNAKYLQHFGIPTRYAEIDLRDLLVCGFAFLLLGTAIQVVLSLWPARTPREVRDHILLYIYFVSMPALAAWTAQGGTLVWAIVAVWAVLATVRAFLVPHLAFRSLPTFTERIVADQRASKPSEGSHSAATALIRMLGPTRAALVVFAIASVIFAGSTGIWAARHAEYFLVLDQCVILRKDAESFLCAELRRGKLTGTFRYEPVVGSKPVLQRLGPLPRYEWEPLVTADTPASTNN